MAKIMYAAGIEKVSGALTKINTKSRHADDQNMFLATHRNAETQSKTCSRAYFRKIYNLPWQDGRVPSSEILEQRGEFAGRAAAISQRKRDLMAISADQANFLALKNELVSKTGIIPSINIFYWAGAKKYSNGGSGVTWPETGGIALTYNELYSAVMTNRSRQGRF